MATLSDLLRAGYVPPTDSALADPIKEHFRTLPEQLAKNQQAMDSAMGSWNKTDFATGQPNPNYRPEAIQELTQLMPNVMGATAWHGTPHKIQGAFDISKVGTGEGAQAYGHGMYFAENPNVAKEYQKMLAGPEQTAAEYLKMYKTPESAISVLEGGIKPNLTPEAKKHSLDAIEVLKSGKELKGNLYKVDIPDEYIPNMLDWDKPLSEQTPQVQKALESIGIKTDKQKLNEFDDALLAALTGDANAPLPKEPRNSLGSAIYQTVLRGTPEAKSAKLKELGITGIRYLDEGSRNQAVQPYYQLIRKSDNAVYTQMQDLKKAEEFVKNAKKQGIDFEISAPVDKRTSNFVVFDPSTVKILEENNKPLTRKELIEQQVNKVLE